MNKFFDIAFVVMSWLFICIWCLVVPFIFLISLPIWIVSCFIERNRELSND